MSDSDIVKDFLIESYENLDRLDRDLVGLEKNPEDDQALAGVFRNQVLQFANRMKDTGFSPPRSALT